MARKSGVNAKAQEIIRCGRDPLYFINNYIKIQHPTKGKLPFQTWPFQDDCVRSFQENRHNVVLKARQLGLSTISSAYVTWMCLFRPDSFILVIATKLDVAKQFIDKCKYAIEDLPDWMKSIQKIEVKAQEITTSRGSKIKAIPTSPDAGRGSAISLLVIDEAAHIRDMRSIWTGIWPTLSTGGKSIVLSTPKGNANKFAELCINAEAGKNKFNLIKLPWSVVPTRDEEWFLNETADMSKSQIAQELECALLGSGDTFIESETLEEISRNIKAPKFHEERGGKLWIWEKARDGADYIISADTAKGSALDYSAFHVIDCERGECCAEYVDKLPPDEFAKVILKWAKHYNNALVCPESNTYGFSTIQELIRGGYHRIYDSGQKQVNVFKAIYNPKANVANPTGKLGIFTNGARRSNMLTKMEQTLRNGKIQVYSSRLLNEFNSFVWINQNKAAAEKGKNDDLVMSFAIACWIFQESENQNSASERDASILSAMGISKKNTSSILPSQSDEGNNEAEIFQSMWGKPTSNPGKNIQHGLRKEWKWLLDD